jgi:hypothetical protein
MSRRAAINSALTVAGVALLVWQVRRAGVAELRADLASVGAGFLLILLISLLRFTCRSAAWLTLTGTHAPLASAVAATISGDALSNLTPLGLVASEPAKAVYLGRHVDRAHAFAALTAENFFYSVSILIYITGGAAALLAVFPLPAVIRWIALVVLISVLIALAAAAWIARQKPTTVSRLLGRLPAHRFSDVAARVREFEARTYGSAGRDGVRLGRVAVTEALFHLLSFGECWLTLGLLTGRSLPLDALVFDALNRILNVVFRMIPMRMGVDEFSGAELAQAIGMPAGIGVALGIIRKLRIFVWAGVGLGLWASQPGPDTDTSPRTGAQRGGRAPRI